MSGGEAVGWGEAALTDVGADGFTGVLTHGAVEVREAAALDAIVGASILQTTVGTVEVRGCLRVEGLMRRPQGGQG